MQATNLITHEGNYYKNHRQSYRLKVISANHPVITFKSIPPNIQGFILLELPDRLKSKILRGLSSAEITNLFRYLDENDIADLAIHLTKTRRSNIMNALRKYEKDQAAFLVKFKPQTAGGLVSLDYIIVYQKSTFNDVKEKLKKHLLKKPNLPTILVSNRGKLAGVLPITSIFTATDKFILPHIKPAKAIKADLDQEEILKIFDQNDRENIVVLEKDESVLGIIKPRDLVKVAQSEDTEDLFGFAGVQKDENVSDPIYVKVKSRYLWLIINLGTAFLAAYVVSLFSDTISKTVVLAAYMPIIAGMGGNTATQTLAVVTRGLALNHIEIKTAWKIILKEGLAGSINGIINGFLVAAIAIIFNQNPLLGLVAAVAMVTNLFVAGFFGSLIPLIFKMIKVDPAVASTVFVTTATDVCGFFVFLGLATLLL